MVGENAQVNQEKHHRVGGRALARHHPEWLTYSDHQAMLDVEKNLLLLAVVSKANLNCRGAYSKRPLQYDSCRYATVPDTGNKNRKHIWIHPSSVS